MHGGEELSCCVFTVGLWHWAGFMDRFAGGEQGSPASLYVLPSSGGFALEMKTPVSYSIDSRL